MSKILMVIAPVGYQDDEFNVPKKAFFSAGHKVTVASKGVKEAQGSLRGKAKVDFDISEVKSSFYDAIVFVGGGGASVFFDDPVAHELVREAYSGGRVIAGICIAPSTLANAGLLTGKRVTAYPSEEPNLREKGANYTNQQVEVDGRIVTANGPAAAKQFAKEIMKLLGESNVSVD